MTVEFPDIPALPAGEFKTVMADPPWLNEADPPHAGASEHFDMLHPKAIAGMAPQVREATASHAHLYLWAAGPFVGHAFDVMASWGFDYKTALVWVKTYNEPDPLPHEWGDAEEIRPYMGMGYYYRSMTEVLLFGTKNNLGTQNDSIRNTIFAPTGSHSEKPETVYDLIEAQSPGPYLEMFARSTRDGWTAYGDEVDCD